MCLISSTKTAPNTIILVMHASQYSVVPLCVLKHVILAGLPTFKQLLSRVKGVVLSALANSELPFSQVLQALSEDQDTLDETCIFQTAFNVELSDAPASDTVQRISVSF